MAHLTQSLPSAAQLPCSDETPVDNQLQNDIPNLLLDILKGIWAERQDWFWGVDMAVYANPDNPYQAIVPDGFLALGVLRQVDEGGRLSYVLWGEGHILPQVFLEVVSQTYNGEYDAKLEDYQALGIAYYVIYNPLSGRRGRYRHRQPLEVYTLIDHQYQRLEKTESGIYWLDRISLGIGCERQAIGGWEREWLFWYDKNGMRYLTAEERARHEQQAKELERQARLEAEAIARHEQQAKELERQEKERLQNYLRSLGIDPNTLG